MALTRLAWLGLVPLVACADPVASEAPAQEPVPVEVVDLTPLEPVALLSRISIDLRGVRPSVDEVTAVQNDPSVLPALVDGMLEDPRFGAQVRALYANVLLTRQDAWTVDTSDYALDSSLQPQLAADVGEETLWIFSHVATQDLPYTEVVRGDWTMATPLMAQMWPLEREEGEGFQPARYTDARPAAGILSTNSFWWRYMSNASNANRGRANAVSKTLLCTDYLSKPIEFERDVNLLDADAVNEALANNDGCVACHYSLDPLASYLWGFFFIDYTSAPDISTFHPERERLWTTYTEVAPAYYGEPGGSLGDLGQMLAADPRLVTCGVDHVYSGLLHRDIALQDTATLTELREVFLAEELRLKPLFRAVVDTPAYQAAPNAEIGPRLMGTDQLASAIEDITGFRFVDDGYDMMRTDSRGLRTLAGGVDGNFVTEPATEPTTTMVLVQERLAQAAAQYAVQREVTSEAPELFLYVNFSETPQTQPDAMVAQIQHLHLRIFGKRIAPDGPEVEANLALWQALFELEGSGEDAWAGLLSVLLRDPDFLLY